MTRDEIIQQLQQIGTCETDEDRRVMLASLQDGITADYDAHAQVLAERDTLIGDNEKLRAANMQLFLRVGDHKTPGNPGGQPAEKLEYKNLFNEKGELK